VALVFAYLGLGAIHTVPLLLLVATVKSYGDGVMRPTLTSLITQHADRSEQGVVLGLNQSLSSVSQIASSLLAGVLIESNLLAGWAWTAAAVALIGLVLCKWGSGRAQLPVAQPAGG
jgi:MFS transporter, DHA1 family, tetracycline resistance protein